MVTHERTLWNLGTALGASRIAHPAYQERPTSFEASQGRFLLGKPDRRSALDFETPRRTSVPLRRIIESTPSDC